MGRKKKPTKKEEILIFDSDIGKTVSPTIINALGIQKNNPEVKPATETVISLQTPPKKLRLRNWQSPGDILMLTAAIRDLHLSHPGKFLTEAVTPCPAFFENSPYNTKFSEKEENVETINCEYPLIHRSNTAPYHFIHGFRMFLEDKLNIKIQSHLFKGDIHLSPVEKSWMNQVQEIAGENIPFWIIVNGGKRDYTCKWWDPTRNQEIIDYFWGKINFVQVGEKSHVHPPLERVIDLTGKTDLRQLVRLMYHADGVVCPVTMLMHLAAAVETKPGKPKNRPCVVIAGGREASHWEAYPHHMYLHTNGALKCCDNGGCWKSRVVPIGDGDPKDNELCTNPTVSKSGIIIPKCLDMIKSVDVIRSIEKYLEWNK